MRKKSHSGGSRNAPRKKDFIRADSNGPSRSHDEPPAYMMITGIAPERSRQREAPPRPQEFRTAPEAPETGGSGCLGDGSPGGSEDWRPRRLEALEAPKIGGPGGPEDWRPWIPRRLEAREAGNPAWKLGEGLLAHFEAGGPSSWCLLVRGVAERRLFPRFRRPGSGTGFAFLL